MSTSPTIQTLLAKLEKNRSVARVNLPALARRDSRFMDCWLADEGYTFISSDFSSLEPSITAHFSEDYYYQYATFGGIGLEPYIDERGILMIDDIYLMTASVMPGLADPVRDYFSDEANRALWVTAPDECKTALKKERNRAKPACLGFNYGMGPKRFVAQCYDAGMLIDLDEAKAMHKAYWSLYKGIAQLVKRLSDQMDREKAIVNPFGYRLTTEPRKAYNAVIQSSASGVVDLLAKDFFTACPEAEFIAFIHDEIIYQIPDALVDRARHIQAECVTRLNTKLRWSIPMRLGFTPGKRFSSFK